MTRIPIPFVVAKRISELAARHAREGIARRGWSEKSAMGIHAAPEVGHVRIATSLNYLKYQNKGIRPFLMTALEGKTVPIRGQLFRVKGVGLPGMGYQDRKNNPVKGPIWREQRWRHPGIKPERFIENAISQALLESKPGLQAEVARALRGDMDDTEMREYERDR